jgi:two-component system response regulator YesN
MSRYHLSHRFREVMGTTFRAYLLRVRLERAKALLTRPEPRVTEVGMAVGLTDLSRFDKLFKRYTGVTPSDYRAAQLRSFA